MLYNAWISKENYNNLIKMSLKYEPFETGGILCGYYGSINEIVITHLVGPGPNAIHTINSFTPNNDYHIEEIAKIYYKSNRTITYLGDWHSHPNSIAYLSPRDKKTIKKISKYKPSRLKNPLMIIVGTRNLKIKGWVLVRNDNNFFYKYKYQQVRLIIF